MATSFRGVDNPSFEPDEGITEETPLNGGFNRHAKLQAQLVSKDEDTRKSVWDVFRSFNTDVSHENMESFYEFCNKVFRILAMIVIFAVLLGCAVISKSTLLYATSQLRYSPQLDCKSFANSTYCMGKPTGVPVNVSRRCLDRNDVLTMLPVETRTVCTAVTVRWIWALFLMTVTPYVLVFLRNLWLVLFKFEKTPTADVVLFVMLQETLYCVGMSIFTFRVLPHMNDIIQSLALMTAVGFFPGLLRIFLRPSDARLWIVQLALDIAAFAAQTSGLLLLPVLTSVKTGEFEEDFKWAVPVSLVLMSLSWWENYVDKDSKLGPLKVPIMNFKVKIRLYRTKAYLIASLWKIMLTFCLLFAFASKDISVEKLFDWDYSEKSCGSSLGPLEIPSMEWDWVKVWAINAGVGMAAYFLARTAAKVNIQRISYAIPLVIATPAVFGSLVGMCESWNNDPCVHTSVIPGHAFWTCYPRDGLAKLFVENQKWLLILWWVSQAWIARHIFFPSNQRLIKTERIFLLPLWDNVIIEQWLMHNRSRRDDNKKTGTNILERENGKMGNDTMREMKAEMDGPSKLEEDAVPFIYICATMWHENETEMVNLLKSLFRLDIDQCARRMAREHMKVNDPDYYKFEAHIFFDDAMQDHLLTQHKYKCNPFVKLLVSVVEGAAQAVHGASELDWIDPPVKCPTPYGGRLIWTMPGGNKIIAHLKDKAKIRHKKRWSQVMYMYYFLAYKLWAHEPSATRKQIKADNCFLLALDGDVDFLPQALLKLVDMMRKDEIMGAACGRIHPTGSGPMVWYQKFEYALGHWMQKATEHVLGCVLCSPGCFSLFRGSALMDHNVMKRYTAMSTEAIHYVQYDQGEDRWLCTLLLQQGYRVQYSAASDSYTFAPEGFNEFYNQRRRWLPSTMANILDLLKSWRHTINVNRNISMIYIIYQMILFIAAVLGSGGIFLMVVGALSLALRGAITVWASFFINLVPIILFVIICYKAKSDTQLIVAQILTTVYALMQMLVLVGILIQISDDGPCSPTALFFFYVSGIFIFASIIHPQEFLCIINGFVYFVSIPSMYMLLMIYSLTNLNVVSWGTREVKPTPSEEAETEKKELQAELEVAESEGTNKIMAMINKVSQQMKQETGWTAGLGNWCSFTCCPRPSPTEDSVKFEAILAKLEDVEGKVKKLERTVKTGGDVQEVFKTKIITSSTSDIPDESTSRKVSFGTEVVVHEDVIPVYDDVVVCREPVYDEDTSPYWITDKDLGKGEVQNIDEPETLFFKDLITTYLLPLEKNKAQEERIAMELLELRNKVSFAFLLINACFVIVVFTLQANTDKVSVPWPCGDNLRLEPIGFVFLIFFGVIMAVQTIGMVIHRTGTFLHIIATTEIDWFKSKEDNMKDQLQLARDMVRLQDDEADIDSRRGSMISVGVPEAPQPGVKRRETVKKLARKPTRRGTVAKNADEAFKLRLEKLNAELDDGKIDDKTAEDIAKKVTGGRNNRKSVRAINTFKKAGMGARVLELQKKDRCDSIPDLVDQEAAMPPVSHVSAVKFKFEKNNEQSQL